MTTKDEARFRHLAACIEATATDIKTIDVSLAPLHVVNIREYITEMCDLLTIPTPHCTQKDASRLLAKKSRNRAT